MPFFEPAVPFSVAVPCGGSSSDDSSLSETFSDLDEVETAMRALPKCRSAPIEIDEPNSEGEFLLNSWVRIHDKLMLLARDFEFEYATLRHIADMLDAHGIGMIVPPGNAFFSQ